MRLAIPTTTRPPDAVTRATDLFNADARAGRINLGIGVYTDASGAVPLMNAVRQAEAEVFRGGAPHRYLPSEGLVAFNAAARELVLGADAPAIAENRAVTLQTLGGTGALMLAARFVRSVRPTADVYVGSPTWDNHRAIFEEAGCTVRTYPYYDDERHAIACEAMLDELAQAARGSVLVLHGCCHNPTGLDLTDAQWKSLLDVAQERELLPVCDLAYQGFGGGVTEDRAVVEWLASRGFEFLVAQSMSKSFALYGERIGSLTAVLASAEQAVNAGSILRRIVRSSYSNPPTQGASLVAHILGSKELTESWASELEAMRMRILAMRERLVQQIALRAPAHDMSFVLQQRGLFSYTGMKNAEVTRLREQHGVHLLSTGRLCVAALNPSNVDRVAQAVADVL